MLLEYSVDVYRSEVDDGGVLFGEEDILRAELRLVANLIVVSSALIHIHLSSLISPCSFTPFITILLAPLTMTHHHAILGLPPPTANPITPYIVLLILQGISIRLLMSYHGDCGSAKSGDTTVRAGGGGCVWWMRLEGLRW